MTKNKKISKEIEEKIQNLASEVYIQIEEKVTQFINAAIPNEVSKNTPIDQNSDYIALQDSCELTAA